MIAELQVENIAIIDLVQLKLGPALSVLTGETGAGKSLLIDAIELVLGERADSELVRSGMPKASVSVAFDFSHRPDLVEAIRAAGIEVEESALYIHREVFAEGRSQCRINGKLAPVSLLRQLGQLLVDLHGQHDHQSLLDPARHVGFFDNWIGASADRCREQVAADYSIVSELRNKLDSLRRGIRDTEHRLDLLRFQVEEIESVEPQVEEFEELQAKLSRLKNVERITDGATSALDNLTRDAGANDLVRQTTKELEHLAKFDPQLEELLADIVEAQVKLEEATYGLGKYSDSLEADPNALEETAGRIDSLKRLRRKYGADEGEVLEFLEQAKAELALLEDAEGSEEEISMRLKDAEEKLRIAAASLTELRLERAGEFSKLVEMQLHELAMPRALFYVNRRERAIDAAGADDIEFFFSANAGEPPRPLSKIASGGEISRVMLGIKTAMAGRAGVPTLIFDEVDSGLGGSAATTVARKLQELAQHYQVLVISHLPAIAARAATHYRIAKAEKGGRVVTEVSALSAEERVDEIARMLVGESRSESARASALELLGA